MMRLIPTCVLLVVLGISCAAASYKRVREGEIRSNLILTCSMADDLIKETEENDLMIANSFSRASIVAKIVFEEYLHVNYTLRSYTKEWKEENCKES